MLAKLLFLALTASAFARPSLDSTIDVVDTYDSFISHHLCPDHRHHHLLPHEYDCTKFYYCEYGMKWVTPRDCAPGTEFSYELQVCVHPVLAKCTLPGVPEETATSTQAPSSVPAAIVSPITTEAPSSITTEAPSSVPASIVSPITTEAPSSVPASIVSPITTEAPSSVPASIVSPITTEAPSSVPASIVSPITTAAPENKPTEWLENGCPASWDIHWLLPHETECNKFYYCVFGELVERSCPPTTYFNPQLQVCDHAENVGCANAGDNEDNGNEDTGSGNGEWLDNGCPSDFDVHWLLPHEDSCSKFYYCVFGEKVERECREPLHFNPALQVCDWAENVGCESNGSGGGCNGNEDNSNGCNGNGDNGSEDNGNEDNGNGDNGNGDNDNGDNDNNECNGNGENGHGCNGNGDNDNNGLLENGCPADFDIHQLLPHESDCSKFYYCVHGEKVERECREPLHFNPALQVCDWAENAGCKNNDGSGDNGNEDSGNGDNGSEDNGNGDNGSEDNGNGDNGSEDHGNGDNGSEDHGNGDNGSEDNGNEDNGNGDNDNNGLLENGCPADFGVHLLLPHESDCSKFYYCAFGEKIERECLAPLHFNPTLQVCDWAENAGCQINDNDQTDNGSEDNGNEDNDSEDNGNGTEETEPDHSKCADVCNILPWAHETACDKFWRCEGEKAVLVICAEGLHFNARSGTCDFICNANCARNNVQTTADHQGLKLFIPWDKVDDSMRDSYHL